MKCEKGKQRECRPHKELVEYLEEKLDEMNGYVHTLLMYTCLNHRGCTYRATPYYMGGPWRDWAMAELPGEHGRIPCHIWGFVDLQSIPVGSATPPGIYMIAETARKSTH